MDFRRWIVIDTTDCNKVNWRDPYIITKNASTARTSIDGTKTLISYNELLPNSINNIASKSEELDRTAVNQLMASTEWFVDEGV